MCHPGFGSRIAPGLAWLAQQGDNKFSPEDDSWGYSKGSGIHISGRIVLNMWRLMRHELNLTSYTYESIAYHILHIRVPRYLFATLNDWYRYAAFPLLSHLCCAFQT
jgi:DNA polymerase zeta